MHRLTVTVDDETAEMARREVAEGRAASVSAWVADAMRTKALARIRFELELDQLRESDPYSAADIAFAAEAMGIPVEDAAAVLTTPIRPARA